MDFSLVIRVSYVFIDDENVFVSRAEIDGTLVEPGTTSETVFSLGKRIAASAASFESRNN